ncbi:uncharacterized protein LOC143332251 [Chaetodon auriga]|uniref:uncharacterized protein LOC143332251 n=1 Tax=Chaetodon auriga TaxID=39042 RepID=UPI004032FFE9
MEPPAPLSTPSLVSSKLLQSAQALIGLGQDRLGSRDGGTEVEGEAIYPRRIRRCVTEVWTVAAGLTRTKPVVPKIGAVAPTRTHEIQGGLHVNGKENFTLSTPEGANGPQDFL